MMMPRLRNPRGNGLVRVILKKTGQSRCSCRRDDDLSDALSWTTVR